jgi:hypothetical protein
MIELTEEQARDVATAIDDLPEVVDPMTQNIYILVPKSEYERLKDGLYDDSPWTDAEMDALAVEVDALLADDMAIEDEES